VIGFFVCGWLGGGAVCWLALSELVCRVLWFAVYCSFVMCCGCRVLWMCHQTVPTITHLSAQHNATRRTTPHHTTTQRNATQHNPQHTTLNPCTPPRPPTHTTTSTNQVMWGAGVAGGLYLAAEKCGGQPLPLYVVEHPWAVWLVGPYFAALTGALGWLFGFGFSEVGGWVGERWRSAGCGGACSACSGMLFLLLSCQWCSPPNTQPKP